MTKTFLAALVAAIKKMREDATDETALASMEVFPEWAPGNDYVTGERLRYNGQLYKVRQDHTSQESWTPNVSSSLFEAIANPSEEGTIDNPIAFLIGMSIEEGKYYTENGELYVCERDSGVPIYNSLLSLVNIYVSKIDA